MKGYEVTRKAFRVVRCSVGLVANNPALLAEEYFSGVRHPSVLEGEGWQIHSQVANFDIRPIEYAPPPQLSGYLYLLDQPGEGLSLSISRDRIVAFGDITQLEATVPDKRFTLLGNQGLLFRYILTLLEAKHNIYTFHACGLYDEGEERAYLILGERGSGKSAMLLAALDAELDLKVFGTEMVHAELGDGEGDIIFHRSTLRNNVRMGHLEYDFPGLRDRLGLRFREVPNPWDVKVQISLERYGSRELLRPHELIIIIPRIEEAAPRPQVGVMEGPTKIKRQLFENISDKINSLGLLYDAIPVGSLDDLELLKGRARFVEGFVRSGRIVKVITLFASPKNCLGVFY